MYQSSRIGTDVNYAYDIDTNFTSAIEELTMENTKLQIKQSTQKIRVSFLDIVAIEARYKSEMVIF